MTTTSGQRPDMAGDVRIVAGIGCASAATAAEIVGLLDSALAVTGGRLVAIASHIRKQGSPVLPAVASHYGVPLRFLADDELPPAVPGVAEAVAAGAGPLLLGKRKTAYATCALAGVGPGFDPFAFGQAGRSNAVMASSIVATSSAGP